MNDKNKTILYLFIGFILGAVLMYFFKTYTIKKIDEAPSQNSWNKPVNSETHRHQNSGNISELTKEDEVVSYVKQNHHLPDFYITKSEARRNGWNPSQGNLCDAMPGKAIGGDHFSNREGKLPEGKQYFEADVNYKCGHRQADRIVFTKDGKVWSTHDHYRTFQQK